MYKKLLNTKLWVLRSPEEQGGSVEETPETPKEDETLNSLKSSIDALTKEVGGLKEDNKTLRSELETTKQELKDTRTAYKKMFGEKANSTKEVNSDNSTKEIDLFEEVANCELN